MPKHNVHGSDVPFVGTLVIYASLDADHIGVWLFRPFLSLPIFVPSVPGMVPGGVDSPWKFVESTSVPHSDRGTQELKMLTLLDRLK